MTPIQGVFLSICAATLSAFLLLFRWQNLIKIGLSQVQRTPAFQRRLPQPVYRFLVIGDSSAVGVGAQQPQDSLAGRLAADYPSADIRNLAKSGARLRGTIRQLRQLESGDHFDILLVQVGANDVVGGTPYPKLERRISRLLHRAQHHATHVIHLMSSDVSTAPIIPLALQWYFSKRYHRVREIFMHTHAHHETIYIDLYRPWSQDPFAINPFKYYSPDGTHPSSAGYAYIYTFIKQNLPHQLAKTNSK